MILLQFNFTWSMGARGLLCLHLRFTVSEPLVGVVVPDFIVTLVSDLTVFFHSYMSSVDTRQQMSLELEL